MNVPHDKVYTGFWGYNSLLTGAALGGNLFVINGHTVAATFVAIIYTIVVQYGVHIFFNKVFTYYKEKIEKFDIFSL